MAGTASPGRPGGARRASRSVRLSRREQRQIRRASEYGGRRALRPGHQPPVPPPVDERARGGRRALRPSERRTHGLPGTLGLTFLTAVVPGTGYLYAKRRLAGWIVLIGWALVFAGVGWYFGRDLDLAAARTRAVDLAFDPTVLRIVAVVAGVLLLVWLFVLFTSPTARCGRSCVRGGTPRSVTGSWCCWRACWSAPPFAYAARSAMVTADVVDKVFTGNETRHGAGRRHGGEPLGANRERVNVLLLGGDGGEGRHGRPHRHRHPRPASTVKTGRTLPVRSLPRNMMNAPVPARQPAARALPRRLLPRLPRTTGSTCSTRSTGKDPGAPPRHPRQERQRGRRRDQAGGPGQHSASPSTTTCWRICPASRDVVDAMGGITVNVNEPVAINGNTDAGIPPTDYIDPGPDQHLDGFHALWFARGRWGSDDYERMERQRCTIDAIIEAADPAEPDHFATPISWSAGKDIVYTDIPLDLVPRRSSSSG